MNLPRLNRVGDGARRAFISVDTDKRLRRAAVAASRIHRLTFEPGDLCYFQRDAWEWSPGMATVVFQVDQGHYYIDYGGRIFKQSAEQLSHVTERERLARDAMRDSQDPCWDTDRVFREPELSQQEEDMYNMRMIFAGTLATWASEPNGSTTTHDV